MSLPVITELETLSDFQQILANNPGVTIIKFGATWCGPCKKVEGLVHRYMDHMPPTIQSIILDIDDNFEVYGFLKSKKMVNGIPAILCYYKGNNSFVPDDVVLGADSVQIEQLFRRCIEKASTF